MSHYLVALIGLVAVFIVGFLSYGVLFKESLKDHAVSLTPTRMVIAAVGMYLLALAFTVLYQDVNFVNGVSGVMKGLYLGLLVGVAFFAIPFFADSPHLKAPNTVAWAVLVNWVLAFAVLGLVVGFLIS